MIQNYYRLFLCLIVYPKPSLLELLLLLLLLLLFYFYFIFFILARTSYIPPKDSSKPILTSGRFQRNVSQPGQSSGPSGQEPSTGITPAVVSPQSGQIRPSTAPTSPKVTAPAVKQTPSSLVSPTRPVPVAGGQMPVNSITTNRPTGKGPLILTTTARAPPHGPPLVPVEGEYLN